MKPHYFLTTLALFAVTGAVNLSHNVAEVWQGESLIHTVGVDAYSGMAPSGADMTRPQQGTVPSDQSRPTGEYKYGSPSNGYGTKPSDPSRKESSGSSNSPYSESIYGGVPTTPSADPLVKGLDREPSIR
ncbi:MAG: hypothetical protein QM706_04115 [Nitrospira sp.]